MQTPASSQSPCLWVGRNSTDKKRNYLQWIFHWKSLEVLLGRGVVAIASPLLPLPVVVGLGGAVLRASDFMFMIASRAPLCVMSAAEAATTTTTASRRTGE